MSDPAAFGAEDAPLDTAAEYVLGVLDDEARRAAAARAARDPLFNAEIEAWERRLAPLLSEVAEQTPSRGVWMRIAAAVAPAPGSVAPRGRRVISNRFGLWVGAAALGVAAGVAAVVIVGPALRGVPASAPAVAAAPSLSARLTTPTGGVIFVAFLDPSKRTVMMVPVEPLRRQGRSAELWLILPGGRPIPVGLIDGAQPRLLTSAMLSRAAPQAVMAVSLEPAGGSPTGAPTGPIVATGALGTVA
jgi:anti-sigma-K factor RskA